jgi:AraC family transcriptional regulator
MIRVQNLFDSALINVHRVDHPADASHVDPEEEVSERYSINLLERGEFSIRRRERTWRVTTTETFLTVPGQVHQYLHHEIDAAPADVCVAVCFTDTSRDEVSAMIGSLSERGPVAASSNRRMYLRGRLFRHLSSGADPIALDLLAGELLCASTDGVAGRLYRPAQLDWYVRRVDEVRWRLDEDFAGDHTLAALARGAGMSAFHFARVFRELVGVPPHRYLLRRRLAAAAQQLRDGAPVTGTCFAVGFGSLSHFITAFRRAYGVSPSRIGKIARQRDI